MKKRIFLMCTVITMVFGVTGCLGGESQRNMNVVEHFVGEWWDASGSNCNIMIDTDNGKDYKIDINWSTTASENTHWVFEGVYDKSKNGILYTGSKMREVYRDDGRQDTIIYYEDGTGLLRLNVEGNLCWDDYNDKAGEEHSFERYDFVEFKKDWYKQYTYFTNFLSQKTLEMGYLDGGDIEVALDGVISLRFFEGDYERDVDGAYVYVDEANNGEMRYYPFKNNRVEIIDAGEKIEYRIAEKPDEKETLSQDGNDSINEVSDEEIFAAGQMFFWDAVEDSTYSNYYWELVRTDRTTKTATGYTAVFYVYSSELNSYKYLRVNMQLDGQGNWHYVNGGM